MLKFSQRSCLNNEVFTEILVEQRSFAQRTCLNKDVLIEVGEYIYKHSLQLVSIAD